MREGLPKLLEQLNKGAAFDGRFLSRYLLVLSQFIQGMSAVMQAEEEAAYRASKGG